MHSGTGVGQFKVHIFVDITSCMGKIVSKIISVHVVVMDVATTVLTLRLEIESDIVPVGRPNFIIGVLRVSEVFGERKGEGSGFQKSHFTLEVLVFAGVVLHIGFQLALQRGWWRVDLRICTC